jgi:hypothetical protein
MPGNRIRPKRINVLHRVEAYTAKAPCSIVAEEMSDETMRGFMKGNGDDYWDRPGCHKINCVTAHDLNRTLLPGARCRRRQR